MWVLVSRFGLDRPSPGPPKISLFFPSLGVFSLNFGWFLKSRTLKCARLGSGCRVKPRRLRSKKEVIDEARTSGATVHFIINGHMSSEKC